ncbi:hypothetical protein OPR95_001573 [Enterococcus hirae]|nr:hypothetical protein [Enterococcus hirae]EMF0159257.1 hypothetical protein [Enterococcus hirae]
MENYEINSSTTVTDACVTKFSIQTNGQRGGDSGHGSMTHLVIKDLAGTYMTVQARDTSGKATLDVEAQEITISFGGDAEFRNFCEGINFINNQLKIFQGGN